MKTTPSPRANVLEAVPELSTLVKTTTRIHPRRGEVSDPAASKIGGLFLWPSDEAWPTQPSKRPMWWTDILDSSDWKWDFPDGTPIELAPVLQLNAKDVSDFPFPSGKDLFQLLWMPLDVNEPPYQCPPQVYWRDSQSIHLPLDRMPDSPFAILEYIPEPCHLTFEKVSEYPDIFELPEAWVQLIYKWQETLPDSLLLNTYQRKESLYQYELSVCPSSKLGGHVDWIQDPEWPTCQCGARMEHLLTLADGEVDSGSWPRWLPIEDWEGWNGAYHDDDRVNAPNWYLGGGSMYYFICRSCPDWPFKVVYQR